MLQQAGAPGREAALQRGIGLTEDPRLRDFLSSQHPAAPSMSEKKCREAAARGAIVALPRRRHEIWRVPLPELSEAEEDFPELIY